jgi:hypothetical protein
LSHNLKLEWLSSVRTKTSLSVNQNSWVCANHFCKLITFATLVPKNFVSGYRWTTIVTWCNPLDCNLSCVSRQPSWSVWLNWDSCRHNGCNKWVIAVSDMVLCTNSNIILFTLNELLNVVLQWVGSWTNCVPCINNTLKFPINLIVSDWVTSVVISCPWY